MNTDFNTQRRGKRMLRSVSPNEKKNAHAIVLISFAIFGFLLVAALFLQLQFGQTIFLKRVLAGIAGCF